jgi:transposase
MKRLLTLTEQQRTQLIARFKAEKNVRLRDRLHCVLLKADGRTNREAAAILLTSEHTVNDWLDRYDEGGLEALCAWEVGGSDPHLSQEQTGLLKKELDTHGYQTAKQVCAWVEAQSFGVTYSERGMRALLHRLGYSRQKAHLVPAQADRQAQEAFLKSVRAGEGGTRRERAGAVR